MRDSQNHVVLIAGACLIFGMLLIGNQVGISNPLRFFLGGILIGGAMLTLLLGHRTWFT
jgi:hypothetical protein